MKKFKSLILSLVILPIYLSISVGGNIVHYTNIFDIMDFIKETIQFENTTINNNIPYDTIQEIIEKYCPQKTISDTKKNMETIIYTRSTINPNNKDQILIDRFNLLKNNITNINDSNENNFCKQNYVLFSLLKTTKELYNGEKNIIVETKTIQKNKTNTNNENTAHNAAPNYLNFTFNHNSNGLPEFVKQNFVANTENYLQNTLYDLVNKNILNYDDIQILNNKINISYQQTCKTTEGDFHILRNKSTNELFFKEINLIVSYCESNNTAQKHQRHVQQILSHELGHYIYFFKDKNLTSFSEICWTNGKNNCASNDFVSNYSKKSPEEDYAESFAYRYLYDNKNNKSNTITQKEKHFENLFGKIK